MRLRGPHVRNGLPLIITISFSILGVVGDYFLKLASEHTNPLKIRLAMAICSLFLLMRFA